VKQRRVVLFALVAAIGLIAIGSRRIAGEHQRIRLGYELTKAQAELRDAREENRRLRLEYSVLVSPERIRPLAEALGMHKPVPSQIRVVSPAGREQGKAARLGVRR